MAKSGYRPSGPEAMKAFCCECCGNYGDGRGDCEHNNCPFYSRNKYSRLPIRYEWFFGPWSKRRCYEPHRQLLKLSHEQYVIQEIFKGNPRGRIGINDMFRAKCYLCCGNFNGGMTREDCNIRNCSIYYWMLYRTHTPLYDWMFDLKYTGRHIENAFMLGYTKTTDNGIVVVDRERYIRDYYGKRI